MKKNTGFVRVKVLGKRPGAGIGRDEGQRWWIRFDDGRAYTVPKTEVVPETVPLDMEDEDC